jgi:WD40 repeat protein
MIPLHHNELGQTACGPEPYAFDLFVIHAVADADFVRGYLLPALNLPTARVLLSDELRPGGVLVSEIEQGVSCSRFTLPVLSASYLADHWALLGEHFASHLSARDARVIPLRLTNGALPLRLEARVSLDFRDPDRWESEAARLRALLCAAAPAEEQIACPYPGMRPFIEEDANRFFGRDREIDDLVGRLDRGEREIYLIGPSGSGKSSLVRAGLLHKLATGSSRLGASFATRTMRPGERPTDRLERILERNLDAATETVDALLAQHPPATRLLIFVDQLEEMFTLASAIELRRFVAALRALRSSPRCSLLLALRADFFGTLLDSELGPHVADHITPLVVAPLRGAALARAVREPAMGAGVHLEMRLCDRLVADAAEEPGALPLVQETLRLLWDRRQQRYLGLAEYDAIGGRGRGLDVAIARRADTAMTALTPAQQSIARRVLLRLVSFGEGRADTRRQQELRALRSSADDDHELSLVLTHLIEHRLVTVDSTDARHAGLADLSHEALITGWPALQTWIDRRRADEQRRRHLEAKATEWIARGRGATSLLDPDELAETEQWMQSEAARELGYGAGLTALVAASRQAINNLKQRHRRRTLLTVGGSFFVALAIVVQVITASDDGTARVWDARIRPQAFARLEHQGLVTAVAFSSDGMRVVTASDDGTARVWDATTGQPVTAPLAHRGLVTAAAFSPDGTHVATASMDDTVRIWDVSTSEPTTRPVEHQGDVFAVVFSGDGTRILTASQDRTARVWDAGTGAPLTAPLLHRGTVTAAAFSPDGSRVITASWDKTAQIWNATSGKPVAAPLRHLSYVASVSFSPDGTRVVTASEDSTARIWDAATGEPVGEPLRHASFVSTASFSPDGSCIVTASGDTTARVWNARTGRPIAGPLLHKDAVTAAAFSPDGARVVTASRDRTARVWDARTGKPVTVPLEHSDDVAAASFSPDGKRIVTASWDKAARVWTLAIQMYSLENWQALAHCAPFVLVDGVVASNPDPPRVCAAARIDGSVR